jgi:outer membrane lipoprotein SlyB
MKTQYLAIALAPALLLGACVTTSTHTTTWNESSPQSWERVGRVESIRETVRRHEGDPAGGAVAGAVIGGLLGGGDGLGVLFGAVGGAIVGAAASQGSAEERYYELQIRFDDGTGQSFLYHYFPPFRPGEMVSWTPQGLVRLPEGPASQ